MLWWFTACLVISMTMQWGVAKWTIVAFSVPCCNCFLGHFSLVQWPRLLGKVSCPFSRSGIVFNASFHAPSPGDGYLYQSSKIMLRQRKAFHIKVICRRQQKKDKSVPGLISLALNEDKVCHLSSSERS